MDVGGQQKRMTSIWGDRLGRGTFLQADDRFGKAPGPLQNAMGQVDPKGLDPKWVDGPSNYPERGEFPNHWWQYALFHKVF